MSLLPEDEQREKSVSHQTVQQLVLEKEQALADLNSVEKSLADLFRRYEKMKEVLEGFRKVRLCSGPARVGGRGWNRLGEIGGHSGRCPHRLGSRTWLARVTPYWGLQPSSAFLCGLDRVLCRVRMKRC